METGKLENIDVFMLQETLLLPKTPFRISGYKSFLLPRINGASRGCAILVRHHIACQELAAPPHCGDRVEVQGVIIQLHSTPLTLFNIYAPPQSTPELGELFTAASEEPTFIGGDFNGHHPHLESPSPPNTAGRHIAELLEEARGVALLNDTSQPTHIRGGRLDLSFISTPLRPVASWSVHPTITSDHFGVTTHLALDNLPQPQLPPPRYNIKRADWNAFTSALDRALATPPATTDLEVLESHVTHAFQQAASEAIPLTRLSGTFHKDHWIYGERVRELNHRLNTARKTYRKRPTSPNRRYLQAVAKHACITKRRLREEAWLQWCQGLDAHSTLGEMWTKLRSVSRPRPPCPPTHPNPQEEAERLSASFADRTSPHQLPHTTREMQELLAAGRAALVEEACTTPDAADVPFTMQELKGCLKRGGDTAPGADGISYSMLRHAGSKGESTILHLINLSWSESRIPQAWKTAVIQPIPKPKDPGSLRPISLLSCLGKTAERMALHRLQWRTADLHPSLFAYLPQRGATDCVVTLLTHMRRGRGIAVFLDLEKAFELASPLAILSALARKGIGGKLLAWLREFLHGRGGQVRFQGHVSRRFDHINGTPQGSILSPFLFNVLMEELMSVDYGEGAKLLCYADDLALVLNHRTCLHQVPHALNQLNRKCTELGLKINFEKSKVMPVGMPSPERPFQIANQDLAYTTTHQYLGVWLDSHLRFGTQVRYLRERAATRTNILRALSKQNTGASYRVLRAFYTHAIRSIIDYCAPCLCSLSPALTKKLEVAQNDALRVILGAPPWTRLTNLRLESGFPSLHHRILARTSTVVGKFMKQQPHGTVSTQLLHAFQRPPQATPDGDWIHDAADAVRHLEVERLVCSGSDLPHPGYHSPPPWVPGPFQMSLPTTSAPRASHPITLRQEALQRVASMDDRTASHYYTDGSLGADGSVGAAFVCGTQTGLWRLPPQVSILQAELAAILCALRHATADMNTTIIIHSDSLSALKVLQAMSVRDNTRLITTILHEANTLVSLGKNIILDWVPSHVGLRGNEKADRAAATARSLPQITFPLAPSLSYIKNKASQAALSLTRLEHEAVLVQGSASASWYSTATHHKPVIQLPNTTPNTILASIRRLRLGFACYEEVANKDTQPCPHCWQATRKPLLHYILECPLTTPLHPPGPQLHPDDDTAPQTAAERVSLTQDSTLAEVVAKFPPPR